MEIFLKVRDDDNIFIFGIKKYKTEETMIVNVAETNKNIIGSNDKEDGKKVTGTKILSPKTFLRIAKAHRTSVF